MRHMYMCMYTYNTYITYTHMWLQLIQHIVLPCAFLRMGFSIQFSWLLFLFGQLNRLWLCVCVSVCVCPVYCVPVCVQYGISISYRYTHAHTLPHTPPPPTRRTCVFNLCALIIHNSINANKLTLSKMLYRFSYSFLFLSLPLYWANNPVSIWVLHIYVCGICMQGGVNPPITLPGN